MNKRGQVIFYSLMLGLVIVILGLGLAPAVKQVVDDARNETVVGWNGAISYGMNCSNPELSNFVKAPCIAADLTIFHFIGGLIVLAGAIVGARMVLG